MRVYQCIKEDIEIHSDGGLHRKLLNLFFNQSLRLVLNYRIGNFLSKHRNVLTNLIILYLKKRMINRYSCDISYQATIGRRIRFPHPIGIVIGVGSQVKDDVMIWQHVTLGSSGKSNALTYPTIYSKVKLYSGAQIIGKLSVGENSVVGASSLVIKDIPDNVVAAGVPAKILNQKL